MGFRKRKHAAWFADRITQNERHYHRIRRRIVRKRTDYQTLEILELSSFGRCLILDGDLQSAEHDEFIYHEALVHPAMVSHGAPRRVLILGGGEGATLREVLRWRTVSRVVMVDIDPQVVELCRTLLPSCSSGALRHKKAQILFGDARKYLGETAEQFDVVISDLPSPIEGGPACLLYTKEFYERLSRVICKKGVFALQCDSFSMTNLDIGARIAWTVRTALPFVRPYAAYVPSFGALWGFLIASSFDILRGLSEKKIEQRLKKSTGSTRLRFYDSTTHTGLFSLPKYLRETFSRRRHIVTDENPIFIFK